MCQALAEGDGKAYRRQTLGHKLGCRAKNKSNANFGKRQICGRAIYRAYFAVLQMKDCTVMPYTEKSGQFRGWINE